jgi:hypothetical protein
VCKRITIEGKGITKIRAPYQVRAKHKPLPPWALHGIKMDATFPTKGIGRFVVGLAYQGNDIVFIFIIEYNSLRDFGP